MTSTGALREPSLPATAEALARRPGGAIGSEPSASEGADDEFPKLLAQLGDGADGLPNRDAAPINAGADRGITSGRIATAWRYSPDLARAAATRPELELNSEGMAPVELGGDRPAGQESDPQGGISRSVIRAKVHVPEPEVLAQKVPSALEKIEKDVLATRELADETMTRQVDQPEGHPAADQAEPAVQPEIARSREPQVWPAAAPGVASHGLMRSGELPKRNPEPLLVPGATRGRAQQEPTLIASMQAEPLTDPEQSPANMLRQTVQTDAPAPRVVELGFQVVRTETHFAPVPQALPMQQIADQVLEAAASLAEPIDADGIPASVMSSPISTSAPPVKVLHIQLQPAELGTVIVRLSLKHDVLDVEMEASQSGTAHLLQRDREVLLGLLRSSGYLVDGMSVQVAEPDRLLGSAVQHTGNAGSSLSQSPTQSQSGGAQTDGRWADGRGQPEQQAAQRGEKPATEGDAGGSITARGIYV